MSYTPTVVRYPPPSSAHDLQIEAGPPLTFAPSINTFVVSIWLWDNSSQYFELQDAPSGSPFVQGFLNLTFRHDPLFGGQGGMGITVGNTPGAFSLLEFGYNFSGAGLPWPSTCPCHVLISIDLTANLLQVYLNDAPIDVSAGSLSWPGTPGTLTFNSPTMIAHWGKPTTSGLNGFVSDFWFGRTASFVDMSVTANRRKFINADLTPVDLGTSGATPFGSPPEIYQSVRSGGVADDWLINRGSAGGTYVPVEVIGPLALEGNPCGEPPPTLKLAMDDVVCTVDQSPLSSNLVSLRWSDDRGHSFGSPVTQSIGAVGEYRTSLQWQRLAYARDRVFEISWSVPTKTALQGCWIDVTPAQS